MRVVWVGSAHAHQQRVAELGVLNLSTTPNKKKKPPSPKAVLFFNRSLSSNYDAISKHGTLAMRLYHEETVLKAADSDMMTGPRMGAGLGSAALTSHLDRIEPGSSAGTATMFHRA